jgi:hypothetical protein
MAIRTSFGSTRSSIARVGSVSACAVSLAILGACGSTDTSSGFDDAGTGGGGDGATQGDGGNPNLDASFNNDSVAPPAGDPKTCAEAAARKSYIGCDYWPTVVANNVWSVFDFAAVVANAGTDPADITVTGPNGVSQQTTVQPGQLAKIFLPWVTDLKGPDTDSCGIATPLAATVKSVKGAYHLVASKPVTVYQFNALEYKGEGGASGKSWASCPGNTVCAQFGVTVGCFSFSNDASLLLPSTAMTGTYRVTGSHGWSLAKIGAYFAVTATQDNTTVTVKVSATGHINAGGGIASTGPGSTATFTLNAGDVAEILGDANDQSDLSGSLVKADKPVQVIAGVPCIQQPLGTQACDHIEESVFPAETLGKDYVVTVPTGPNGAPVGHVVRFYGNADGTTLTYLPSKPASCPSALSAGQVVECGTVTTDFEVTGTHEFSVGSFMLGGAIVDGNTQPPNQKGDPSQSLSVAVEQFRKKYIFLAPNDYDVSYVDVAAPVGTGFSIDGIAINASYKAISAKYGVARVKLSPGNAGAHVLEASNAVGIQVMGYGAYTSYQYPGGLDLVAIAPPPPK